MYLWKKGVFVVVSVLAISLSGGMATGKRSRGPSRSAPAASAKEDAISGERGDGIASRLDALLKRMSATSGPVGALLQMDDAVVYRRGIGGVDDRTEFETASCSKWLIAAALMTLVDEGRVGLDDPVARYLPAFQGKKERMTLRHLLSHTSGLPHHVQAAGGVSSLERAVDRIGSGVRLSSDPGERFCYGNLSYQVAARVAEVVAGEPWPLLFQRRIAEPSGMETASFPSVGLGRGINQARSTLSDYVKFLRMFQNGGVAPNGRRVLSPEAVEEMLRDQTRNIEMGCINRRNHRKMDRTSYGLGLWRERVDPETGRPEAVSHFGTSGFRALINYRYNYVMALGVKGNARGKKRQLTTHFFRTLPLVNRLALVSF